MILAGKFARIDAVQVTAIPRLAAPTRVVIVAVRDTPGSGLGLQRLATVKTLRPVDHVMLYTALEDLLAQFDEVNPDKVYLWADAELDGRELRRAGIDVEAIEPNGPPR